VPKQRFEDNPDVRHFLARTSGEQPVGFDPRFLRTNPDREWISSSLSTFYSRGHITDVLGVIRSGKEATVYLCAAPGGEYLAAKVYRPRMLRNLKNDAVYRTNRLPHSDWRYQKALDRMSTQGKAFRMESWIENEYETHRIAYRAGIPTPEPVDRYGNAILMEFVGTEGRGAPHLAKAHLTNRQAQTFFYEIIESIESLLGYSRIHADLSAFNVLYSEGRISIIDFAQSVDARTGRDVYPLLVRDIDRIAGFFVRFGVRSDATRIAESMWARHLNGVLEDV
jgi:RIO kinase 1